MMGFNSFFRFLFAFPLEAVLATCFAFWIAAALIWEPFMVPQSWEVGLVVVLCADQV